MVRRFDAAQSIFYDGEVVGENSDGEIARIGDDQVASDWKVTDVEIEKNRR